VVEQVPGPIEALLATFEHLCDQIESLDEQTKQLAADDPTCKRLMTIPGVGPQVVLAFTTQLDEVERFASADELASYLALVPGEATTGGKVVRTSTIKAGPGHLKALLVQAAWSMYRTRPNDPAVLWMQSITDKRGKRIAVVALARKLATIMWSMWKHGTSYDPARASTVRVRAQTPEQNAALRSAVLDGTATDAVAPTH
jgi:transposase